MRMEFEKKIGDCLYFLKQGDLTLIDTQAIVNAANSSLMGGGGVDGAIHRRGGPQILEQCQEIRDRQGRCSTGQAVITTGGNLAAKYILHTVGPVWQGGDQEEDALLASCYRQCLALARDNNIRSVAFPSISTGAYRFPLDRAARIAQSTVLETIQKDSHFLSLGFVLYNEIAYQSYRTALDGLL